MKCSFWFDDFCRSYATFTCSCIQYSYALWLVQITVICDTMIGHDV